MLGAGAGLQQALVVRRASPLSSSAGHSSRAVGLEPVLAQQPRDHQAVAAVVALAADDPHRARPDTSSITARATSAPARSISSSDGMPSLVDRPGVERPHLVRRVQRLEPVEVVGVPMRPSATCRAA